MRRILKFIRWLLAKKGADSTVTLGETVVAVLSSDRETRRVERK